MPRYTKLTPQMLEVAEYLFARGISRSAIAGALGVSTRSLEWRLDPAVRERYQERIIEIAMEELERAGGELNLPGRVEQAK